jgi:hypothetical protein
VRARNAKIIIKVEGIRVRRSSAEKFSPRRREQRHIILHLTYMNFLLLQPPARLPETLT